MPGPLLALIPLAISAATSIYQGIKGAKQKREAQKLQDEADQKDAASLADARRMALTGMPEAEYMKQLQEIYRNQATALGALRDRRSALSGATSIQQATNDATLALASKDAQMRREAERTALGQANRNAGITREQGLYERESGQALTGAAMQNLFNTAGAGSAMLYDILSKKPKSDSSGIYSGMKPLDTTLYGSGGYSGGLGYAKPY
jgi:hypothetical protein